MRKNQVITLGTLIILLNAAACTKEHRADSGTALISGTSGASTLSSLQEDVLKLSCAVSGCHDNRANPAGSLDLSSYNKSYTSLVGKKSTQAPALFLVSAGDADHSYLLLKIQNTHVSAGGTGVRMPLYAAPLAQADVDRFITWVNDGAQLN